MAAPTVDLPDPDTPITTRTGADGWGADAGAVRLVGWLVGWDEDWAEDTANS